jgi:hypothetical protein
MAIGRIIKVMANATKEQHPHRLERYIRYALVILGAVFLALVIFFVAQYESLRRTQLIDARRFAVSQLLAHHAPLPVDEAATVVRSWMTFQYLNKIFGLPPDYLQTHLQISSASYPRLTISSYAKSANLDEATFIGQVDTAIENFVATSTASSTASARTSTKSI